MRNYGRHAYFNVFWGSYFPEVVRKCRISMEQCGIPMALPQLYSLSPHRFLSRIQKLPKMLYIERIKDKQDEEELVYASQWADLLDIISPFSACSHAAQMSDLILVLKIKITNYLLT